MSTAVLEISENAPSVCLWRLPENPYRLMSLYEMSKKLEAGRFVLTANLLGQLSMQIRLGRVPSALNLLQINGRLDELENHCRDLGLAMTLMQIARTKQLLNASVDRLFHDAELMVQNVTELANRLNDELATQAVLIVDARRREMYEAFSDRDTAIPNAIEEQWGPIFNSFSSTKFDALEAFRSLAIGLSTASVFHLMRVLEIGLSYLGAVFGVSLAHTNWAPAIEEIEKNIRNMRQDPRWKALPDVKDLQEYYSQAASHFVILKDAWRNYTAHARGKYTEKEASDIFTAVGAFMQKLAARACTNDAIMEL